MTVPGGTAGGGGAGWPSNGYTCVSCNIYVPFGITHVCPGFKVSDLVKPMQIVFKPQLGEHAREVLREAMKRADGEITVVEQRIERDVQMLESERALLAGLQERAAEIRELLGDA